MDDFRLLRGVLFALALALALALCFWALLGALLLAL